MGFKEVASLDADVTVALGKRDKKTGKAYPKSAEGYYLGSRKVKSRKGDSVLHFLQTKTGNLGVWGTTDLNRKLSQVPAGTMVRVTSTGMKPTPNGDMYVYKVEQDTDNSIEVNLAQETAPADDGAEDTGDDAGYDAGGDSEDDGENEDYSAAADDEDDSQTAALAAAEAAARKAKVDAILKAGKSKAAK